jgi:HD-GYP domain-containing protein (c-di-GMP phosphodiesterase class II)
MYAESSVKDAVDSPSPWASGAVRIGIALAAAGVLLLGVSSAAYSEVPVYAALGGAGLYGVFLLLARPGNLLRREPLARLVPDVVLVSVLVAGTGGETSMFSALYALAALELARVRVPAWAVAGAAVLLSGYLGTVVVVSGPGVLAAPAVLWRTAVLLLFCALAGAIGSRFGRLLGRVDRIASELEAERSRTEKAEGIVSGLGPVLSVSSDEGILRWAAEAARGAADGSYAHAAALQGHRHQTVCSGDAAAYPTWWHPEIQRLLLWSCRENRSVWSDEEVHGMKRLLAVPIGPVEDENWGALIVGGDAIGEAEERVLWLVAGATATALQSVKESPAGRDQTSGLPNRASLERVLARELSQGRALTLLVADAARIREDVKERGSGAVDAALSAVGERLAGARHRAFRYGRDEFAIIVSGNGKSRARRTAATFQQLVVSGAGEVAVGYAFAEAGQEDPEPLLRAADVALAQAREQQTGAIAETPAATDSAESVAVVDTVRAMAETLEHRDPYIRGHLESVARLAREVGIRVSLPAPEMAALITGALLHDIGKIGIPDRILQKTGRLTSEEYEAIKRHPALGARMLSPIRELADAVPVVRHHHERYDGRGYPDGLRGSEIPLTARIVAVADAFDAMVRGRPYESAIPYDMALREIEANAGTQFDPHLVQALLEVLESEERPADSTG